MEETPDEYAWMFQRGVAASARPTSFLPTAPVSRPRSASARRARCGRECLEYALLNRIEHGVWGGASERERRRILRRRRDLTNTTHL